jgi:hypothetical protein
VVKLRKKRVALWEKMDTKIHETHVGFTGAELAQMCTWVDMSLHDQLQQLTLPKCRVTEVPDPYSAWGSRAPECEQVSI